MNYFYKEIPSPVGVLKVIVSEKGLAAVLWENDNPKRGDLGSSIEDPDHPMIVEVERQLKEYFEGRRKIFSLKLDVSGTEFQKKVWKALASIPFGETRSYGQLAKQIGNPKAMRAVGAANGKNPVSIIVPCHRVIGASGQLVGFAGGLPRKSYLLRLEGKEV